MDLRKKIEEFDRQAAKFLLTAESDQQELKTLYEAIEAARRKFAQKEQEIAQKKSEREELMNCSLFLRQIMLREYRRAADLIRKQTISADRVVRLFKLLDRQQVNSVKYELEEFALGNRTNAAAKTEGCKK